MKIVRQIFCLLFLIVCAFNLTAQVEVNYEDDGAVLCVNSQRFFVNGMNWDHIPIGKDAVNSNFWQKSDNLIKEALDNEMGMLKKMHVNTIRIYSGVPPKWITYIFENHGIYTMLNHPFGRYGLSIDGNWIDSIEYGDPKSKKILLDEVKSLAQKYKDVKGLLLYLLGNENNYGLFWEGSETENFPSEAEKSEYIGENRARPMYSLMNQAAIAMKTIDSDHPVAICNGDIVFIDIIAEECGDVDIYGTNIYRGMSFGNMFQVVKDKLDMPILLTEFGVDAYNAITESEDQLTQANYALGNWNEIYGNASRMGNSGYCIGGFTFQFSDGWWKHGFDDRINADVHDTTASWSNGGYKKDYIKGKDNMNEEWFGICAKGPTTKDGLYPLLPRAAYFTLAQMHLFDPYSDSASSLSLKSHVDAIDITSTLTESKEYLEKIESHSK